MYEYEVKYYDGQSSRSRKAFLLLRDSHWQLIFRDENDAEQSIRWEIDQIKQNDTGSALNTFHYGDFPHQSVEIEDPTFIDDLRQKYPNQEFVNKTYHRVLTGGWKVMSGLAVLTLLLFAFFGLVVVPNSAALIAGQIPRSFETKLGENGYQVFMTTAQEDTKRSLLVNRFARQVDFDTDYPIRITVVESSEINAFALPGGRIVIFSGLLDKIGSAEELAALLGHEVGHVKLRHSIKAQMRSLSTYLFISLLLSDVNGVTAVLMDNANMLSNLSYSRKLEHLADAEALTVLQQNHLSQSGLVDLFRTLQGVAGNEPQFLKFLSSHPLTQDRLAFAKKAAAKQRGVREDEALTGIWEKIERQGVE
jgi:beta-barrel assembly-enhancing protease